MELPKINNKENCVKWNYWIGCILDRGYKLTKWELDFVYSLKEQIIDRKKLTEKQIEILEQIYYGKLEEFKRKESVIFNNRITN
jgi:hypothetical protein